MASNMVRINDMIKFKVDDSVMAQLIVLLSDSGSLLLDCPWCGLTVVPQARSQYSATGENEFKVSCVGCSRDVPVRMYNTYGFVVPSKDELDKRVVVEGY